jgi:hypothetical protein
VTSSKFSARKDYVSIFKSLDVLTRVGKVIGFYLPRQYLPVSYHPNSRGISAGKLLPGSCDQAAQNFGMG